MNIENFKNKIVQDVDKLNNEINELYHRRKTAEQLGFEEQSRFFSILIQERISFRNHLNELIKYIEENV